MALMGLASQQSGRTALKDQAFKQLETVNTITGQSVERYFRHAPRRAAGALRRPDDGRGDPRVCGGSREHPGRRRRRRARASPGPAGRSSRSTPASLRRPSARRPAPSPTRGRSSPPSTTSRPGCRISTSAATRIRSARRPGLDAADDASAYTKAHALYHPILRNLQEKYGLYDLFLVDAASGRLVYSVCKEIDFAASLRTGPIAGTNLGLAFQEAVASGTRDAVAYAPFDRYLPSLMQPASFIAAPGLRRPGAGRAWSPSRFRSIGSVAIIGETTGMGTTGETYAVGADRLFRSESRFTCRSRRRIDGAQSEAQGRHACPPGAALDEAAVRHRPGPRLPGHSRCSPPGGRSRSTPIGRRPGHRPLGADFGDRPGRGACARSTGSGHSA